MKKLSVELTIFSPSPHISQIAAGFLMLKKQGKIDLKIKTEQSQLLDRSMAQAVINGRWTVAYDTHDGYNKLHSQLEGYLQTVDCYFKRSFSEEENAQFPSRDKIFPLGLNYEVTCAHNPINRQKPLKQKLSLLTRKIITKSKPGYTPDQFEYLPSFTGENAPKILFCTRLWDPDRLPDDVSEEPYKLERSQINETRIELLRKLKEIYGEQFCGGLYVSDLAKRVAPDLVMDPMFYLRENYLRRLKEFDICIGSTGLHKSIGWKTAEYVAASKAIVCEKLYYSVPGNFNENENYRSFETTEECLEQIRFLMDHPREIVKMQWNNYLYYQNYVRPDMLVLHSLTTALSYITGEG